MIGCEMKNTVLATATLAFISGAALAGSVDPISVAPVPVVAAATGPDWGGFYIGGFVSRKSGAQDTFVNDIFAGSIAYEPDTGYGGFIGFNVVRGSLVFGAEVDYDPTIFGIVGTSDSSRLFDMVDLKARAGVSFGKALVYGVVGYSTATYLDVPLIPYPVSGLDYGVGVDYMITNKIFVGAEYLARNMSGVDIGFPARSTQSDVQTIQIRAGINF